MNVIWITFMLSSFLLITYATLWLSYRVKLDFSYRRIYSLLLVLICMFVLLFNNSNFTKTAINILNGSSKNYAYCFDLRIKQINDSKDDVVYVKKLPFDSILSFDDITDDINDWKNQSYYKYYGKKIQIQN